jgi:hypothetical protein
LSKKKNTVGTSLDPKYQGFATLYVHRRVNFGAKRKLTHLNPEYQGFQGFPQGWHIIRQGHIAVSLVYKKYQQ